MRELCVNHAGEEYILFCDAELYNSNELMHELKAENYSDEEIILYSYIKWKEKALDKFNGVFAFAVLEKSNKILFLARDRIGVKPFFYALKDKEIILDSSIKKLLEHITPQIDEQAIAEIILIGPGRTPGYAIFKNIHELEPAHYGIFKNGELKKYKYWDMVDSEHTDNFNQTIEKTRFLVIDSIERQLDAKNSGNNKICTLLSGGLDSSIITSLASEYLKKHNKKLYSFSVDYKDNAKYFSKSKFQPESDGEYIEIMKTYLNNSNNNFEHHQIILDTQNLVNSLYTAVDARDFPGMADVDASLLLFCEDVKNFANIALSGESADEIFGGYPWYRDKNIREKHGFPWSQSTEFRKSFLKKDLLYADNYINERYLKAINESDTSKTANSDDKRIKELVNLNIKWFMQTLLERQNRMSEYNNFKIRAPFCDYRIVEYLYNIPWEYKDYNNTEKGLLRIAMQNYLPERVLWRKKSPYPKTHNPEYLNAVSKILREIINESSSPLLKIIKKESLENLIKNSVSESSNQIPWYGQLMTTPQTIAYFIQINYWLEKYKINIL